MSDRPALPLDLWVPSVILAGLSVTATLGFHGIFGEWGFLAAAVLGAVGAALVVVAGRILNLVAGETVLVGFAGFALLGPLAAGGIGAFADGLTGGWAELLSTIPPADLTGEMRVLPYTIAFMGTLVGSELLRSVRTVGLPAIGPIGALVASMLLTFDTRGLAIAQGAIAVVGAIVVAWFQQRLRSSSRQTIIVGASSRTKGLLAAALAIAIVAVSAPMLGPRLPLSETEERFDLRQYQDPRFDPLAFPSPLAQLKASLTEASRDLVVFTASTDGPPIARWPIAVLPSYDGVNWIAADERPGVEGEFTSVGSKFPAPTDSSLESRPVQQVEISIRDYSLVGGGSVADIWLPVHGWPVEITTNQPATLMFSQRTGATAVPGGVPEGLVYELTAVLPRDAGEIDTREPVGRSSGTTGDQLTGDMLAFAADVFEGADAGQVQVAALQERLREGGYTAAANTRASRPGHSMSRLQSFLQDSEQLLGFEEQYAAAAALLLRSQDVPARVVVGYLIPDEELEERWEGGDAAIRAGDISAWVEVLFAEAGWVPIDVTPPRIEEPEDQAAGLQERAVAAPNPPPEPEQPDPPPRFDQDDLIDDTTELDPLPEPNDGGATIPWGSIATGVAYASPLLIVALGVGTVLLLKARRTRRRRSSGRPARRVAGAWQEVLDRSHEVGFRLPEYATPRESARSLLAGEVVPSDGAETLMTLVVDVEDAAGHPTEPGIERAEAAWGRADEVVAGLHRAAGRTRRIRTRIDPRPLFRPDIIADGGADE